MKAGLSWSRRNRRVTLRWILVGLGFGAVVVMNTPTAQAHDLTWGQCPGGGAGFRETGWCDGPGYPDGSYDHTVEFAEFWSETRVCPPDPANPAMPLEWVEGQDCAFHKPETEPIVIPAENVPVEIGPHSAEAP